MSVLAWSQVKFIIHIGLLRLKCVLSSQKIKSQGHFLKVAEESLHSRILLFLRSCCLVLKGSARKLVLMVQSKSSCCCLCDLGTATWPSYASVSSPERRILTMLTSRGCGEAVNESIHGQNSGEVAPDIVTAPPQEGNLRSCSADVIWKVGRIEGDHIWWYRFEFQGFDISVHSLSRDSLSPGHGSYAIMPAIMVQRCRRHRCCPQRVDRLWKE